VRSAIDVYVRLIGVQIRAQLQDPIPFMLELFAATLITTLTFGSLALILQRFDNIGGWSLGEIAFLYGMVETAFGLMDMLFSGFDPPYFGRQVRLGSFDQLLLRPLDITLQIMGSRFIIRRLGRIIQGFVILGVTLASADTLSGDILSVDTLSANIHWTLVKIAYLPVVLASQVCFFGGLFVIGSTLTFWTVQSLEVINIFTYGGSEMMAYPMHIYREWMRRFFTFVIPAIFLNYYPALFFLDKADPFNLPPFAPFIAPLVGPSVLAVGLAFWRFGIRHYQSTGS
jgi:ABC-2 type transport system permease protein